MKILQSEETTKALLKGDYVIRARTDWSRIIGELTKVGVNSALVIDVNDIPFGMSKNKSPFLPRLRTLVAMYTARKTHPMYGRKFAFAQRGQFDILIKRIK